MSPTSPHRALAPARRPAALVAAGLAVLAGACASEADDPAADVDPASATVEYRYHDSSVPPEYHRSYTLTVGGGEAHLVVDSYGDLLHDETEAVDGAEWDDLLAAVTDSGVEGSQGAGDGCSGGTGRELRVTDDDHPASDPAVLVAVEVCGGDGGDAADEVDALVEPVLAHFDMETLLATG